MENNDEDDNGGHYCEYRRTTEHKIGLFGFLKRKGKCNVNLLALRGLCEFFVPEHILWHSMRL